MPVLTVRWVVAVTAGQSTADIVSVVGAALVAVVNVLIGMGMFFVVRGGFRLLSRTAG